MKQPLEPSKEDCCNSGCNPCVFDVYEKQLKRYEEYLKSGKEVNEVQNNAISELEYTSFTVVNNQALCKYHNLIAFKKSDVEKDKRVFWKAGDHFLVKYSSEEKTVSRAYTPLKGLKIEEKSDYDFLILVKSYSRGVVSHYLCNLILGEKTLWRGPYGSYEYIPSKFNRIFMIAQGTGVAPFISIIQNVLRNEDDYTKLVLYLCCHSHSEIILREELYSYKSYWNFSYTIFLNHPKDCISKYQEPINHGRLSPKDIESLKPFSSKDQVLISGSAKFMKEYETLLKADINDNIITF